MKVASETTIDFNTAQYNDNAILFQMYDQLFKTEFVGSEVVRNNICNQANDWA